MLGKGFEFFLSFLSFFLFSLIASDNVDKSCLYRQDSVSYTK